MKLSATTRGDTSLEKVRAEGLIPAVFYGKEEASTAISLDRKEFIQAFKDAGTSTILDLEVEGDSESKDILIREIQRHPVSEEILHVDLYVVTRGEEMEQAVTLEFVGEAPAEKDGAVIMEIARELLIRSMPRNLPSHIDVDLSMLKAVGDSITVADIPLPEGVTAVTEGEETIANASAAKEEVTEDEEAGEIDMAAIEVEQKGKGEEESAE